MRLMKASAAALLLALTCPSSFAAKVHPHVDDVDPLIGTSNDGRTVPNVGIPFGMTQWTPATRNGEARTRAPYYYNDKEIVGLRASHFMSGSGTKDYGSFQFLAGMDKPDLSSGHLAYPLSHAEEKATPYLYQLHLPDAGVSVAMTGTTRCGLLRFRFEKQGRAWISIQNDAKPGDGSLVVDPASNTVTGENKVRRIYVGSGQLAGFSGYIAVEFDHPFHVGGRWSGRNLSASETTGRSTSTDEGTYVTFDVKPGEEVQARIGTSFVSTEEALRNLHAEIPHWDFLKVQNAARRAWNNTLGSIDVTATDEQRRVFYTALYHASQVPRICNDVSGSYPRFASPGKIEHIRNANYYDDFSLWDTFRALHPLLTLIDPAREGEMAQSLILKGQQGGYLPMFPAWASYTQEMLGDHAVAVIGDAYLKGIRNFDIHEAYRLMKQSADTTPAPAAYQDGQGRRGLASYQKYGYIPLEDPVHGAFHDKGQVSRTLEYAYDDFVLSEVARALGETKDAERFAARAQNFRNVIDPQTGLARGRHDDGTWDTPFDPDKNHSYFIESNARQNALFVPQDMPALVALEGGPEGFIRTLDDLFTKNQYDQGNEPSHHIAYLYDYAGAAWKTQERVSAIRDQSFHSGPDGLPGNDDAGQMSAWYLFTAMGFYPVTPGLPSYAIGSPQFSRVTLHLPRHKAFTIEASDASVQNRYIVSASLNGVPLRSFLLSYDAILHGGILKFQMSDKPVLSSPAPPETHP